MRTLLKGGTVVSARGTRRADVLLENGRVKQVGRLILGKADRVEDVEGCLSCPGEYGITRRPKKVKLKAQDRYGKYFFMWGEDLTARCICHESDHLDGILFKEHVIRMLDPE